MSRKPSFLLPLFLGAPSFSYSGPILFSNLPLFPLGIPAPPLRPSTPPFFSAQVRTRTTFGLRYGRWWRNRTWLIFLVRVINGSPISGDRETPARSCWGWTASAKPSPSKSTPTNPRRRRGFSPCSLIRRSVCRLICCWVFFPAISVQKRRSISSHSFPPSLCIWRPWSFLDFSSLVALAVVRFSFLQLRRSEK